MTLDAAEIDLSKSFAHGQSYVALSRVRSLEWLRLLWLNEQWLSAHPLVIRWDTYFQQQSEEREEQYKKMSNDDRSDLHGWFVQRSWWVYVNDEEMKHVQFSKKQLKAPKPKIDTVLETKKLLEQWKQIEEIMELRHLTRWTIISHIWKVHHIYPDVDLFHVQPDQDTIDRVQDVVNTLVQNEDNWTESGSLRLAAVYNWLGKEISYEELKLYMAFVEIVRP